MWKTLLLTAAILCATATAVADLYIPVQAQPDVGRRVYDWLWPRRPVLVPVPRPPVAPAPVPLPEPPIEQPALIEDTPAEPTPIVKPPRTAPPPALPPLVAPPPARSPPEAIPERPRPIVVPERRRPKPKPRPKAAPAKSGMPSCAYIRREYERMTVGQRMAAYMRATSEQVAHGKRCLGM